MQILAALAVIAFVFLFTYTIFISEKEDSMPNVTALEDIKNSVIIKELTFLHISDQIVNAKHNNQNNILFEGIPSFSIIYKFIQLEYIVITDDFINRTMISW